MSYSFCFCVFEPKKAPKRIKSFLKWIGYTEDGIVNEWFEQFDICDFNEYEKIIKKISPNLQALFWDISKYFPPEESEPDFGLLDHQVDSFCSLIMSSEQFTKEQIKDFIELVYQNFPDKSNLPTIRSVQKFLEKNNTNNNLLDCFEFTAFSSGLRASIVKKYPDNANGFSFLLNDLRRQTEEKMPELGSFLNEYEIETDLPKEFKSKFIKGVSPDQWVSYEFNPKWMIIFANGEACEELHKMLFYLASMYKLGFIDLTPRDNDQVLWFPDNMGELKIADSHKVGNEADRCYFCDKKPKDVEKIFKVVELVFAMSVLSFV